MGSIRGEYADSIPNHAGINVIKNVYIIVEGMTCTNCTQTIENHLKGLNGVVNATVSLLTHKANVQFRSQQIGLRTILEEIEALGFTAKYEAQSDKADIRVIINESVRKYRNKFLIACIF